MVNEKTFTSKIQGISHTKLRVAYIIAINSLLIHYNTFRVLNS